jgi:murein DD-endopeptidase MepM/ murein hydrolase activator NlpD
VSHFRRTMIVLTAAFGALTSTAAAAAQTDGGAGFPGVPAVQSGTCPGAEPWRCHRGEALTLTGDDLAAVKFVVFHGKAGTRGGRKVRPERVAAHELVVIVPRNAASGPLDASDGRHTASAPRALRIVKGAPSPTADATVLPISDDPTAGDGGVFPIRGVHDMGQTAENAFGGARHHGGQDLFAACGTPLVAVRSGTVQAAKFQDRAGNYVVLQAADGQSYTYFHMQSPSLLHTGDPVVSGQPVGKVGDTGRATGCHLHFEQWTAPGWYTGGHAIDPLPQLRLWEAAPHPHR